MPRALALLAVASLTLTSCLVGNPVLSDVANAPTAAPSLTDIAYGPATGCANAAVDAPCGGSQLLDIYPATAGPSRGTIVWIHGGGLFLGDKSVPDSAGPVFEQLERGWSVVSVNYRLLKPKSPPGQSTTVPSTTVASTAAPSTTEPTTGVPSTAAPSTTSPATTAVPSTTATSATPPQTNATDTPTTTVTPTTSTPPATGSTTGTTVAPDSDTGAGSGAADATTAKARRIVRSADSYENTYPTALRDVISAVDWVKANGADHGLDTCLLYTSDAADEGVEV